MTTLENSASVSCPWCGARSLLPVPFVVEKTTTWTHACPVCKGAWNVKVFSRRGVPELSVTPAVPAAAPKKRAAARKTVAPRKRATRAAAKGGRSKARPASKAARAGSGRKPRKAAKRAAAKSRRK
jgi:hypothetical protein